MVPKLRFPEFLNTKEWDELSLSEISDRVDEKVGDLELITVSISSGIGFVAQANKFGRDISGEQYKNYILLKEGEFAYNKGNSKKYPQGCIYKLKEFKQVAAPNVFICFRFKKGYVADFFQGYFENNYHGIQLQKFITSSARSTGLLNISSTDFFSIKLPTPFEKAEQQKIATCLTTLDELITAQGEKIKALQAHKKGLMQRLFPAEGEMVPRVRFGEFEGEWEIGVLGDICKVTSGGTPNRAEKDYWDGGNIPWVTTTLIDFNVIDEASEFITEEGLANSSAKIFPKSTILMAMYGQGKTRGKVAVLGIDAATNQACAAIILKDGFNTNFVFQYLASHYDEIRKISNSGGQENLSAGLIESILFVYPSIKTNEQQKIAACLTSLDELLAAQSEKLEALKRQKKGLMQQMFPSPNER